MRPAGPAQAEPPGVIRGGKNISAAGLRDFLAGRGVSKEYFPEHVVVLDEMPVSAGGKIARRELKAMISERIIPAPPPPGARPA